MAALQLLVEQQKIRAIGLSNFSCSEISAAREFGSVDCLQAPFSALQRRADEDLIPYCRAHAISVLAYSPLAKGLLTGKFTPADRLEGIRARDPEFLGERFRRNLQVVEALRATAENTGKSVAQVAINWTAYHPGVTAPIVGAKRASQVVENAGGVGWQLADADRDRIDALLGEFQIDN
jgi:aryl-alcohol dehydrogenase-like predicted oxidoreductase